MHMNWVITTNSNNCRIYCFHNRPATLVLLKELEHRENRLKKSDALTSDRPGHYQKNALIRGAYEPHTDLREIEIHKFAREIANEINLSKNNNFFDRLIILSDPHMMGVICQYFSKSVKNVIIHKFLKNFQRFNANELLCFIKIHTRPFAH